MGLSLPPDLPVSRMAWQYRPTALVAQQDLTPSCPNTLAAQSTRTHTDVREHLRTKKATLMANPHLAEADRTTPPLQTLPALVVITSLTTARMLLER
jgi:hypothetical protein